MADEKEDADRLVGVMVDLTAEQRRTILAFARLFASGTPGGGAEEPSLPDVAEIHKAAGARMRSRREALGMSAGRLGRRLGLGYADIGKFERGEGKLEAGRLLQIAILLGVTPSYLFGLTRLGRSGEVTGEELRAMTDTFAAMADEPTRLALLEMIRSLP